MPDLASNVAAIAETLERIAESTSETDLLPLFATFGATVIGGFIGFCSARWPVKEQQRKEEAERQERRFMVQSLLRDEICKRWGLRCPGHARRERTQTITMHFHSLRDAIYRGEVIAALDEFSTTVMDEEDLFVIQSISHGFHDYCYLEDTELISRIIHAHVLIRDLIDTQKLAKKFFRDNWGAADPDSRETVTAMLSARYRRRPEPGGAPSEKELADTAAFIVADLERLHDDLEGRLQSILDQLPADPAASA